MFTGIVEGTGIVEEARVTAAGRRLVLRAPGLLGTGETAVGDSIAVDGCCLTAAAIRLEAIEVDVIPVTLARTTLGALGPGARVNLERALRLADRISGHLVQGHIDGTARVVAIQRGGDEGWRVRVRLDDAQLAAAILPRGSIALGGVSLTVVELDGTELGVALVPETLARTTLAALEVGDALNVETDMIGKYVAAWLARSAPRG